MMGKSTQAYIAISELVVPLTSGLVIALDPSIGSSSSMPGYAVYRAGELVDSGVFNIKYHKSIPERLKELANKLRKLYNVYPPDVLVYEEIPVQRYGGGNATSQASLLKALGAILSVPGPDGYVGIAPASWKAAARDTYVKSDVNDAIEIGWVAISTASTVKKKGKKNVK